MGGSYGGVCIEGGRIRGRGHMAGVACTGRGGGVVYCGVSYAEATHVKQIQFVRRREGHEWMHE